MADIREISQLPPMRPIRPGDTLPDRQKQPRKEPPKHDATGALASDDDDDRKPTIDEFA